MHDLPQEVLSEILSWLDVSSLLRFKTVCKEWCSLIDDPAFIRDHMKKSKGRWVYEKVRAHDKYFFLDSCYGIILEHNKQNNYRLRNPSTRKILALPDLGVDKPFEIPMRLIESSSTLKLAVTLPNQSCERGKLVCKVLSVGIDSAWRDIVIPFPSNAIAIAPRATMLGEVYFVVCTTFDSWPPRAFGLHVVGMEMGSERVSSIRVPNSFFSRSYPRNWRGRLALVGEAVEDEIHIWVLEDDDGGRSWAEEKIAVPLEFVGPRAVRGRVRVFGFHGDDMAIMCDCSERMLLLDVPSGKIKRRCRALEGEELSNYYVPSLQHFQRK